MIFTLHRYIFREVFKVFVLAVVALTLILSLGSILRPVQEYGVGPRQAVHLMGYILPIILTFVLPIAALFAGALVYGRFASDNELDACKASGISLLTLVYPGLALAIMVTTINLILSFHVTPIFVHLAEKSLKADAKQILFRNIQRRGYYKLPQDQRYLIYADYVNSRKDILLGVVVMQVENGRLEKISAVESAKVTFNPHGRFTEVRITAHNPYHIGPEDELWFSSEWLSFSKTFGSLLGDDIKFKKINEMKRIQADPMRFDPIAKLAYRTYAQYTTELLAQDIENRMLDAGYSMLEKNPEPLIKSGEIQNRGYKLHSGDKFVAFTAGRCRVRGEKRIELSGPVVVAESNVVIESDGVKKLPFRTLRCKKALLHIEGEDLSPVFTITLELYSPQWQQVDGRKGMAIGRLRIPGLIPPKSVDIRETFKTSNVLDAIRKASQSSLLRKGPTLELQNLQSGLQRRRTKTLAEIASELHSRLVFGIGCVPMILIGIGLGVIKRGGHLLGAFAASCVPAAVLIVCIMCGKNITENLGSQGVSGIVLMWTGLGFLLLLAAVIYYRLLRN
ncbi:MAG: LptF/LptG family permease [Sedimentisphaerales bacterium]